MHEETVVTPNGTSKRVIAANKEDLAEAVSAAKNESVVVSPDINVPVKKGHDLLAVESDGVTVGLADGSGAHNSPRDAVRDDGSIEGDKDVPVVVQKRNSGTAQAANDGLQKLVSDGKLADFNEKDAEKAEKASDVAPSVRNDKK